MTARHVARNLRMIAAFMLAAHQAPAAYMQYGAEMQELHSREVANGALYLQSVNTWLASTPTKPYTNQAAFALPACQAIDWARLCITVWGGTRDYTNRFTVALNNITNLVAQIHMGTSNDVNPSFQVDTNCVYGLGFGVWLVTVPVPPSALATDGSTNLFITIVEDPAGQFDGRQIHMALMAVYRDRAFNNRFTCSLLEGPADIYRNQVGGTNSRAASFSAVDTNGVLSASLSALYTYGASGERDRLYLNEGSYGGDDVSNKQTNNPAYSQVPDLLTFAVTNLNEMNTVRFSVNTNEISGTCETSLRPHWAVLAYTREPWLDLYESTPSEQGMELSWAGWAGWVYSVESATDLFTQDWAPVAGLTSLIGSNAVMHATDPAGQPTRVYRIHRAQP
jgi:hypothetical protein